MRWEEDGGRGKGGREGVRMGREGKRRGEDADCGYRSPWHFSHRAIVMCCRGWCRESTFLPFLQNHLRFYYALMRLFGGAISWVSNGRNG